MAAEDDEIARLLREVDAVTGSTQPAAPQPSEGKSVAKEQAGKDVERSEESPGAGARSRWVVIAAAGTGAAGFLAGTMLAFLPFVDGFSTAIGAAAGAALTAAVGGPPRWLR
jgi:hypothetical protein